MLLCENSLVDDLRGLGRSPNAEQAAFFLLFKFVQLSKR
jgi:hypothetical protein